MNRPMTKNEIFESRIDLFEVNINRFSDKQIDFAMSLIDCYMNKGVTKVQYEKFLSLIDHQLQPKSNKIYAKYNKSNGNF